MGHHLHHVAVLVRSLSTSADSLPVELERLGVESFPSEGTREQYVDLDPSGQPSLLLIESIGDGPYRRTLEKRGVGLHHFGFRTSSLDTSIGYFAKKGLLLHPVSMKTLPQRTVWMCRPGVPFLVELTEIDQAKHTKPSPISVDLPALNAEHIDWLPDVILCRSRDSQLHIASGEITFQIAL